MNTWYFKVKGRGTNATKAFGFYVNCLITTDLSLQEAKEAIFADLTSDALYDLAFEELGIFDSYHWNNDELQKELNDMKIRSKNKINQINYSDFHTWEIKGGGKSGRQAAV